MTHLDRTLARAWQHTLTVRTEERRARTEARQALDSLWAQVRAAADHETTARPSPRTGMN